MVEKLPGKKEARTREQIEQENKVWAAKIEEVRRDLTEHMLHEHGAGTRTFVRTCHRCINLQTEIQALQGLITINNTDLARLADDSSRLTDTD